MRSLALTVILGLLLTGCATSNKVLVATGTVIGLEIAENPSTGLYQAKLGYARAELALVPTTNQYCPDVLVELQYSGMLSRSGGIYQRLAVGPNAVTQPGAMAMFAKDSTGKIDTNVLAALKASASVPTADASLQSKIAKLAMVYKNNKDNYGWNDAAKEAGYDSFAAFLIDPKVTQESYNKVEAGLRSRNLIQ